MKTFINKHLAFKLLVLSLALGLTACSSSKKNKKIKASNSSLIQQADEELKWLEAAENVDTHDSDAKQWANPDEQNFENNAALDKELDTDVEDDNTTSQQAELNTTAGFDNANSDNNSLDAAHSDNGLSAATNQNTSSELEPIAEVKPTWVPVKKMMSQSFKKHGVLINALYIARPGDTLARVVQKIYQRSSHLSQNSGAQNDKAQNTDAQINKGSKLQKDQQAVLLKINPYLKKMLAQNKGQLKVGTKVYYNSPRRPQDKNQMLFFYQDLGLAPTQHVLKQGQNIRIEAKKFLGHSNSWQELWATHPDIKSKWILQQDYVVQYWPQADIENRLAQNNTPQNTPATQAEAAQAEAAQAEAAQAEAAQAEAAQAEAAQAEAAQAEAAQAEAVQDKAAQQVDAAVPEQRQDQAQEPTQQAAAGEQTPDSQQEAYPTLPDATEMADTKAPTNDTADTNNTTSQGADATDPAASQQTDTTDLAATQQADVSAAMTTAQQAVNTLGAAQLPPTSAQPSGSILQNLPSMWQRFQSHGVQGLHQNERNTLFIILASGVVGLTLLFLALMWWRRRRLARFQKAAHKA